MINEILAFYNGSAEEQEQFAEELEQLDDHQQLALRVYLEFDASLLSYHNLHEAVELAEEAFQGQYDCGGDFAAGLMEEIDSEFADKVSRWMGWQAWQQMWDYSLHWDYEYVEVDNVGYIVRQM